MCPGPVPFVVDVCLEVLVQGVSAPVLLGRIICRNVFHEEGVLVCGKARTNIFYWE